MKYYGYLRRHDSIQKRILKGKIDGGRGRGRRRQTWLGNIQETSQMKMCEVCETALDRRRWRTVTATSETGWHRHSIARWQFCFASLWQ
ncbi:hypothetical protein ElyMa_003068100 [Elysia marginata]|uniref:Uncharacterized protein n=1 Tax=Elysia marginata TaxID=1093978 RepID=A0AAV4IM11_9GAST|nr:hypothetical protein ElyMa_003068100 [Elysia marginata]